MHKTLLALLVGLAFAPKFAVDANGGGDANFDILNGTLDDLEDLPEFKAFPSGAYIVELPEGMEEKVVGGHPSVTMKVKHVETKELSDPNTPAEKQAKPGDQGDLLFMLDNETGRGFLKLVLKAVREKFPHAANNRELMGLTKGVQALIVVKFSHNEAKQRDYMNLTKFALV